MAAHGTHKVEYKKKNMFGICEYKKKMKPLLKNRTEKSSFQFQEWFHISRSFVIVHDSTKQVLKI